MRDVKYSLVFKLFLIILLPLTLGWKLALRPATSAEDPNKAAQRMVASFLTRQHFSVALTNRLEEGQPSVVATAGACRVLAAKSPAMGWDRDLLRQHATSNDRVFVVFRGKVYDEQPTWLTVPDYLWSRVQRELGINREPIPVFAIIAPAGCQAERLPWHELVER